MFEIPSETSKILSESSEKIYTRALNKLDGVTTVEDLKKYPHEVVQIIRELYPGTDEKSRHSRRVMVSAIFWVLPENYRLRPNPYQKLNLVSLPSHANDGEKWDPNAKRFLKKQEQK